MYSTKIKGLVYFAPLLLVMTSHALSWGSNRY